MKKISFMDGESKNIEIYNLEYDELEMGNYINSIKNIGLTKDDETIHAPNYEETILINTESLKNYLRSLLNQNPINLSEINKLVKSNSPIRNVETMLILKEFMNKINFNLDIKIDANQANKLVRELMQANFEIDPNEDIETLVVSAATHNRDAFQNIGFAINNEKNKTR